MSIRQLRGLRFPDEFVIRFFFKNQLHTRAGNVLELGCGNGNNLLLFHEYGWNVVGLDISEESLANAEHNFRVANHASTRHRFIHRDLSLGLGGDIADKFDVILLPNVLYYIPRHSMVAVLQELRRYSSAEALVFLRNRSMRDYRFRRGEEVERNGYCLSEIATGELGLLNVFYYEWELIDMLRDHLGVDPSTAEILTVEFQNPQQGSSVNNSDIVIWGPLVR